MKEIENKKQKNKQTNKGDIKVFKKKICVFKNRQVIKKIKSKFGQILQLNIHVF